MQTSSRKLAGDDGEALRRLCESESAGTTRSCGYTPFSESVGKGYSYNTYSKDTIFDLPEHGLVQVVIDEKPEWMTDQDLHTYLKQDEWKTMGLGTPLTRFALVEEETYGKRFFCVDKALYGF